MDPSNVIKDFFTRNGSLVHYTKGELVLHAHTRTKHLYLITEGIVKAYSIDKKGTPHVHALFTVGKCLPLVRAIQDSTNHIICEAHTNVAALRVSREVFMRKLEEDHAFTRALLDQSLAQFALFTDRIENLEYGSARERLLYRLLTLGAAYGIKSSDNVVIAVPQTHEDLAQSIQVSREVVSRLLSELKKQGLIEHKRGEISFQPQNLLKQLHDNSLNLDHFGY